MTNASSSAVVFVLSTAQQYSPPQWATVTTPCGHSVVTSARPLHLPAGTKVWLTGAMDGPAGPT